MSTSERTNQLASRPRKTPDGTLIIDFKDIGPVAIPRHEWEPYYKNGKLDDSFLGYLDDWYRYRQRQLRPPEKPQESPIAKATSDILGLDWTRMSYPQKLAASNLIDTTIHGLMTGELPVPPDPRTLPRRIPQRIIEDMFYVFPAAKPVRGPVPRGIRIAPDPTLGLSSAMIAADEIGETIGAPRQLYGQLSESLPSQMAYKGFDIGVPDSWPGHLRTRAFLETAPPATKSPASKPTRLPQYPPLPSTPPLPPDQEGARTHRAYLDVRNVPESRHRAWPEPPPIGKLLAYGYPRPPEGTWRRLAEIAAPGPLSEYEKYLARQRILPPKSSPNFSPNLELFHDRGVADRYLLGP